MSNCDIWASVDFGHGPVEVRCTQKGNHTQHRCEVFLMNDRAIPTSPPETEEIAQSSERRNIFEP